MELNQALPLSGTSPWPVRNRAARRELSCRGGSEASSAFAANPQPSVTTSAPPHIMREALDDSQRSTGPCAAVLKGLQSKPPSHVLFVSTS